MVKNKFHVYLVTAGALHWITQPYVHRLRYTAAAQEIEVLTTTLFGRQKWVVCKSSPWCFISENACYSFPFILSIHLCITMGELGGVTWGPTLAKPSSTHYGNDPYFKHLQFTCTGTINASQSQADA